MKETKYTKEDWINGKVALEWENNKAKKINKFFKECNKLNTEAKGTAKYYYCTEKYKKGYYDCANTTNLPIVKIDDIVMEEIYSIEDLKSRKDGKCWVVQIKNREQYNFLLNYFPNMMSYDLIYDGYLVDKTNTGISHFSSYWREDYNKITITQIKEYVMKEIEQLDSNNMEKKISAYQVKSKYSTVASKISIGGTRFVPNSATYNQFLELGVLDIWFEVEYEPEKPKEEIVSMGQFDLLVTKHGIFHKRTEDITKYVEQLINTFTTPMTFQGFICVVSTVEFKQTGCQKVVTNLEQWRKVWTKYLDLKTQ